MTSIFAYHSTAQNESKGLYWCSVYGDYKRQKSECLVVWRILGCWWFFFILFCSFFNAVFMKLLSTFFTMNFKVSALIQTSSKFKMLYYWVHICFLLPLMTNYKEWMHWSVCGTNVHACLLKSVIELQKLVWMQLCVYV